MLKLQHGSFEFLSKEKKSPSHGVGTCMCSSYTVGKKGQNSAISKMFLCFKHFDNFLMAAGPSLSTKKSLKNINFTFFSSVFFAYFGSFGLSVKMNT